MAGTQNSISSLVAQFLRLQQNSLQIINGLNQVANSTNQTVSIQVLDEQGLPKTVNIPSYGYMSSQIETINSNIRSLAGIDNGSTVRNPDGTYSQIFKAQPIKNPAPLTGLQVPSSFSTRNNWFFESFLSPLLYISIDVTGKIDPYSDRILVKRIIANTTTQAQQDYFDNNLKGRNDISHDAFIQGLEDAGIGYYVDEEIVNLPVRQLRYVGSFGVLNRYTTTSTTTDPNGQTNTVTLVNWGLSKLTYTDTDSDVLDGKTLNIGDKLLLSDGSIFSITNVDLSQASIQVERISGYGAITLGADTFSFYTDDLGPRFTEVNVGYNERQGVFFKPIDENYNIVSANWSDGVTFWSNELTTLNSSNELVTLEQFYLQDVADMGQIFLDVAKEKTIPAVKGLTPTIPTVTDTNFKVVQINTQVTDSVSAKVTTDKIASKTALISEISSLDVSINQTKSQLNQAKANTFTAQGTGDAVNTIQSKLDSLINEKSKKSQLYASIVKDIKSTTTDLSQINTAPKYRVRGFWPFPAPSFDPSTGEQQVIGFKVRYRYLSDSGNVQPTQQIQYKDINGQDKTGAFSNWVEYSTPVRKKVYDSTKGIYVWADEDTDNADAQNVNQLDIPIQKGERVEIQIASVSEAGYPANPLVSDFSSAVTVQFPSDLSADGVSEILKSNEEDAAVVRIQEDLNAQGLPQHLSEQFTENTSTFYHLATGIASGFFTPGGSTISLFDKLNDLQNQIIALQSLVSLTAGVLEVYLLDGTSSIKIEKGQRVNIVAGFYNQELDLSNVSNHGKIVTKTYIIQLINNQATPVELASIVPGGSTTQAPVGAYPQIEGYSVNQRYGGVPISLGSVGIADVTSNTSITQAPPFASAQVYGQYIYSRFRNVGLDVDLYLGDSAIPAFNDSYDYLGSVNGLFGATGALMPLNGSCLIPYDPTQSSSYSSVIGGTAAEVWLGTFSGSNPIGAGYISEFCIHTSHPALNTGATASFVEYVKPVFTNVQGSVAYPEFRHSLGFFTDSTLPDYRLQTQYRIPSVAPGATAESVDRYDSQYPDKNSFSSNDEYLLGKYSCGSYLFLSPADINSITVDGFTALNGKRVFQGNQNALAIPLVYQYRCTDKLGYIGGWRKSGTISNITYSKAIGIDLQQRNQSTFSFDVIVKAQFRNSDLVAPNFGSQVTPPPGSSSNIINISGGLVGNLFNR